MVPGEYLALGLYSWREDEELAGQKMIVNSASQRAKEVNQVYIFVQGTNPNEVGDAGFFIFFL